MNTKRVAAAEGVILAAMKNRVTAAGVAVALESACLLQSPESAAEARQLQDDITGACLARWEEEQENTRLRAERHSTNEALSDAAEALRVQRDRIAELEAELKKYVGVEPTVAEELAYVSRCLHAVYAVCDAAAKQATRWENPLPVPEWVVLVRNAADGVMDAAPALLPAPPRQQEDVSPQVEKLRGILAGQRAAVDEDDSIPRFTAGEVARWQARQQEDPHTGPLHHDYTLGRELPEVTP